MQLYRMYWRRTLRKPGSIYLWLMLPFIFMAIYSAAFGGGGSNVIPRTGLAVLDQDGSMVSELVPGALGQGPLEQLITVREVTDMDAMAALFADEKVSAGLVIPKGFGNSLLAQEAITLKLYKNPRHFIGPQIAEGVINTLAVMGNGLLGVFEDPLAMINQQMNASEVPSPDEVADVASSFYKIANDAPNFAALTSIDVTVEAVEEEDETAGYNMASLFFPGLIMFGLLSVSLSLETRFLYDRLNKVTHRLVTAPVRPASVVLQQRLYAGSFIYVVGLVSALLGGLIWRIPPNGLVIANVITIALVVFIIGLNGTIFGLSSSIKATSAISSAIMMALLIVGGGFFPAEFTPEGFQAVSRLTPTGIANIGLTQALTGRELSISLPALMGYSGLFLLMSIVVGRRRII